MKYREKECRQTTVLISEKVEEREIWLCEPGMQQRRQSAENKTERERERERERESEKEEKGV